MYKRKTKQEEDACGKSTIVLACLHDCFTHSSFFHGLFLLRLRLLLPGSLLRTRKCRATNSLVPLEADSKPLRRLGGDMARKASSGARWDGSGRP